MQLRVEPRQRRLHGVALREAVHADVGCGVRLGICHDA